MPELPDVEGFRRRLERHGRGRRIGTVDVLDAGVVRNASTATLRRRLTGRRLSRPERRGQGGLGPPHGPAPLLHLRVTRPPPWGGGPPPPHPGGFPPRGGGHPLPGPRQPPRP